MTCLLITHKHFMLLLLILTVASYIGIHFLLYSKWAKSLKWSDLPEIIKLNKSKMDLNPVFTQLTMWSTVSVIYVVCSGFQSIPLFWCWVFGEQVYSVSLFRGFWVCSAKDDDPTLSLISFGIVNICKRIIIIPVLKGYFDD